MNLHTMKGPTSWLRKGETETKLWLAYDVPDQSLREKTIRASCKKLTTGRRGLKRWAGLSTASASLLGSPDLRKDSNNSVETETCCHGKLWGNRWKHGNWKSCDIWSKCCDVWGPSNGAVGLPWRLTGRSSYTLTIRNRASLGQLLKIYWWKWMTLLAEVGQWCQQGVTVCGHMPWS